MKIVDFNYNHIEQAGEIARLNYEEERGYVPALPKIELLPELNHFAENELGVVAFEGDKMVGFLGTYAPRDNQFGTTDVRGTFSPIHAHGVISNETNNRDRIYSLLYQEAAKKWVNAGIRSHAIALYTHDQEAIRSFFYQGFGLRCIDAVRSLGDLLPLREVKLGTNAELEYGEVPREEWKYLLEDHNALISHLGMSPSFMKFTSIDEAELYHRTSEDTRYFAAKLNGSYVAYIKLDPSGENFATEASSMRSICGAYCKLPYRGTGIYHNLLSSLITILHKEGYQQLGVDCESFNPTARGFWLKYFNEYTHSVVRRIDDKAIAVI